MQVGLFVEKGLSSSHAIAKGGELEKKYMLHAIYSLFKGLYA